jgi:hypothetical protein
MQTCSPWNVGCFVTSSSSSSSFSPPPPCSCCCCCSSSSSSSYYYFSSSSSSSSSSTVSLQSYADLRLFNRLLPVNSVFYLCFQFVVLRFWISVCAQLHHLLFCRPLSRLTLGFLLNIWLLLFAIHSVNINNPIQPTFSDAWKYNYITIKLH